MLKQEITKCNGIDFTMPVMLVYSGLDDSMLKKYMLDNIDLWEGNPEELPYTSIGATIGTHVGPGAIGVAFFHK